MSRVIFAKAVFLCLTLMAGFLQAATVYATDIIPNGSRTNFMGFESLPETLEFGATYSEDGIVVTQGNGSLSGIWTTYNEWGPEGDHSWYPNGGDNGYTSITRSGGIDFVDVGLLCGSGFSSLDLTLYYTLLDDGGTVQFGSLPQTTAAQYLGFSGGGFDEIRLRDSLIRDVSLLSRTPNALAIDSIELYGDGTALTPEPSSIALTCLGIAALALWRRSRG